MKYSHLLQIANYLSNFKKITTIKRVGNMNIYIGFDKKGLFFDLSKSDSSIYANDDFMQIKEYQAPFDNIIKKRLNNSFLLDVLCLKNNRILKFVCEQKGSYKSIKTILYLEFTGRFTNAIVTDENGIILEALRHIDSDFRKIETGEKLKELGEFEIKEKSVLPISDFDDFFATEFDRVNNANFIYTKNVKLAQIDKKIQAVLQNINTLEDKDELLMSADKNSKMATLLLANLSNLKEYERKFQLIDFDGNAVDFILDDSPKVFANKLFNSSKRLKAKANGVDLQRENLSQKLDFLRNLSNLINSANSVSELEILLPKKNTIKKDKTINENIKSFYIREFKILIGKNESANLELLKNAKKNDIWVHLKDLPSPHVIIKTNKLKPDEDVLEYAAKICLNFSSVGSGRYEIDYTKRENVKIINGANVNYINYKTIILSK
ncbi:hypothetical protein BFG04_05760 [Campylobacter pinnipediorum subsp. pinnipediorum]|uniref:NFACT RNA-binding domain-containing protein n=1 Tax=Campylobacter pinnipediorum subsp. pinnipediorum TaxID=1660067 RepID=A0AAX0L8F8_9BACT|nr:NFACT RNA binding domain-containing protein [Campylobacter pinnipediorum]OPA74992.1 hypothetical protein BFG04_05760 [Campylobacter pinnipediorum subsp. pinnipediorum]